MNVSLACPHRNARDRADSEALLPQERYETTGNAALGRGKPRVAARHAEPLHRELADRTNGVFLPLSELHRLPDLITERTSRVSSFRETDIWSTPLFFLLLMLLLSSEWIVRKVSELK